MAQPERTDGGDRTKNIVRGIGSLAAQGVLTSLFGFVLLASLLRFLPSHEYGAYSAVSVSVGLASVVGGFGLAASLVKFLAPRSSAEGSEGWGAAKASVLLTLLFTAATSAGLALLAPSLSDYFLKGPSSAWLFDLGALWLFSASVSSVLLGVLQALRRYSLMARLTVIARFAGVGVAVVGLVAFRSLAVAIASWALYYAIIGSVAFLRYRKLLASGVARPYYSPVLRYAAPLAVAGIVAAVASNADIVVVGGYLSPTSLGVYNAAVVISGVVSALFVTPLATALFAETSFSAETSAEVSRGTGLALRFTFLTVLPASFFAAAMAPQLFDLFSGGGAYAGGVPYLQLITLFYGFQSVETVAIYVLQGVGLTRRVLVIGAVTAIGEVVLSAALVPSIGLAGAAYSRVGMFAGGCALSLYYIRRYLPRPFDYRFLGKALVASAVPALAVYLPSELVSSRVITIVPYAALGLVLFAACAKALKLISDEDRSFLSHLLPRGLQWVLRLL
ncbi:MAG: oligosaccharide flippase family protein [Nitrososphaerota archaeon]|nr:oligosaccharide flippase family protein [Nitrososphaerota archaeon]